MALINIQLNLHAQNYNPRQNILKRCKFLERFPFTTIINLTLTILFETFREKLRNQAN